jgi:erythromycin esterase-like protein
LHGFGLLLKAVGGHRLVLLGEIHGTRETPALVGALVDRESAAGDKVILGLEIVAQDQAGVDRYLRSRGHAADRAALLAGSHWRDPMHDGRDSAAMFDLIEYVRSLREQGRDIEIVFFDPGNVDDRDRGMADCLRGAIARARQAKVLVLTGNVHAMTAAPPWEMLDGGKRIDPPMTAGRLLADLQPFSIDIGAAAGNAWNCTGTCGVHPTFARGAGNAAPSLEFLDPSESAWDAVLLLPRFSASPPAIEALQ